MSQDSSLFRTAEGEAHYMAAYDAVLELWPVAYEALSIPTQIGTVHAIVSGPESGPPLILLPMASMSATMWFPNVGDLSRVYRVYALDTMNDLGKSIPTQPCRTRSASAAWLLDVLDALGIKQTRVVGASYGGWLALNLAIAAPERVIQMALLAPAGSLKFLSWKFFVTMGPAALFPHKQFIKFMTRPMTAKGFVWNEQFFEQVWAGLRYRSTRKMFNFAVPVVFSDDELRQLRVPVLLLLGDQEIICNPHKALNRAKRLFPHIDAEIIPGVGHGLSQEQPTYINSRILEFFALD